MLTICILCGDANMAQRKTTYFSPSHLSYSCIDYFIVDKGNFIDHWHHHMVRSCPNFIVTWVSSGWGTSPVEIQCLPSPIKNKITSLYHPTSKYLLTNPQEIADAFSDYYSSFYNLHKDHFTPQPTEKAIK